MRKRVNKNNVQVQKKEKSYRKGNSISSEKQSILFNPIFTTVSYKRVRRKLKQHSGCVAAFINNGGCMNKDFFFSIV